MNQQQTTPEAKGTSDHEFGLRLGVMTALMLLFFLAIVSKLLGIQVLDVKKYRAKASRQYEVMLTEKARRGRILDRQGRPLAESVESISFYADPKLVTDAGAAARLLSETFGKSRGHYLDLLRKKRRFVWLERNVPVAQAASLMSRKIEGIGFRREQHRHYLNVAAQLIGLTDRDNKGISGLEKSFDKELRGRDGVRVFQRSATGERYPAPDAEQVQPMNGNDVMLTIDADVQGILEEEIARAVAEFKASSAMGIVMDARTGEIIAMANYPTFDMNRRSGLTADQMRNRAVTDMFEPGSTFKIVMAAAATESLQWRVDQPVDGHGGTLTLYGKHIRDHEPFGVITFQKAISVSSNVIAATTAMKAGPEVFYRYARALGFGQKSGVGLIGESGGRLKPVSRWGKLTLPWMGYGYQVMATPLQVLQAYATMANDGTRMRPFVIRSVTDSEGKKVMENAPLKVAQALKPETSRYMAKEYFREVVENGTGKLAAIEGIPVAGKTGTAQKLHNGSYQGWRYYVASFAGFFPYDNPQYAAIIVVDEPQTEYYASAVAAPVFSRVCGRALASSLEMQKRLSMKAPEKELLDSISTVIVPDLKGLRESEAAKLLEWYGLKMEPAGSSGGSVISQSIAPGAKVQKETTVRVSLAKRVQQVMDTKQDRRVDGAAR
ncbi:peptidoglycan glycosyltransferase [Chlorobaculum limnaeum]|uniref:Peptidoglycan glycosyltransferase n=1 Tax=Chlorobaculum limnaeum TaxID=274537 RepID=A0A1D8D2U6_CHLLM|nr:penicillin-binding protein [Chlorobaculum limnaeum]AOS84891.1 peptidoglycan glycosyltransferase [Chlorobaculum limnaeum]